MFWGKNLMLLLENVVKLNLAILLYFNAAVCLNSKFLNSHIYTKLYKDHKKSLQEIFKILAANILIIVY